MKISLDKILSIPVVNGVVTLLVYVFYSVIIGVSLTPPAVAVWLAAKRLFGAGAAAGADGEKGAEGVLGPANALKASISMDGAASILKIFLFCIVIALSLYLFFLFSLLVFGLTERLLTHGIKPGKYEIGSPTFIRWLINGGVHTIALNTMLPFMIGSDWVKLFFRLIGCKMGKGVFINTKGLHDSYLLRLGDNVVIGGDVNVTCHLFEGKSLILKNIDIGENTLIGAGAYIMPGAEIGRDCNVGAYSVIRKNRRISDGTSVMPLPGLPMRQIAKIIKDSER